MTFFLIFFRGDLGSYSKFLLAALHDSNWYTADFAHVKLETEDWGSHSGCSFAMDKCVEGEGAPHVA